MKYTVKQIDRMRELIEGWYAFRIGNIEAVNHALVEDQLRTYVMAGVKPEELEVRLRDLIIKNEKDWSGYIPPGNVEAKKHNEQRRDMFILHYRLDHVIRRIDRSVTDR